MLRGWGGEEERKHGKRSSGLEPHGNGPKLQRRNVGGSGLYIFIKGGNLFFLIGGTGPAQTQDAQGPQREGASLYTVVVPPRRASLRVYAPSCCGHPLTGVRRGPPLASLSPRTNGYENAFVVAYCFCGLGIAPHGQTQMPRRSVLVLYLHDLLSQERNHT